MIGVDCMERHLEELFDEYKLVSSLLNEKYNRMMLADTDEEYDSLLQEVAWLEERYERLIEEIDDLTINNWNNSKIIQSMKK